MTTSLEDRIASMETALSCALDTIRKLSHRLDHVEDRMPQTPLPGSPAAQRAATEQAQQLAAHQAAQQAAKAQRATERRAETAKYALALMDRLAADQHILRLHPAERSEAILEHLESARPWTADLATWARAGRPEDGTCRACTSRPHTNPGGQTFAGQRAATAARTLASLQATYTKEMAAA